MAVDPGDRLRITAVLEYTGGSQAMNVFDLLVGGPNTQTDQATMDSIQVWMGDVYEAATDAISGLVAGLELRGFNETANAPLPVTMWTSFNGGSAGGELLPFGCAGLLLFRTGQNRVLGRKFVPGLTEANVAAGVLSTGAINALALFAAELAVGYTDPVTDQTFSYGVKNKVNSFIPIIGVTIRAEVAYQRRRKRGVGV